MDLLRLGWLICLLVFGVSSLSRGVGRETLRNGEPGGRADLFLLPEKPGISLSDRPAFLGVFMQAVDGKIAAALGIPGQAGVMVAEVMEESPAMEAGIKAGDVILSMEKVSYKDVQILRRAIMKRSPGEKVSFELLRGGKILRVKVKLGERAEDLD